MKQTKEQRIVEKIHNDFYSSTDELIFMANSLKESAETIVVEEKENELGTIHQELGFTNTPSAQEQQKIKKTSSTLRRDKLSKLTIAEELDSAITQVTNQFPVYKIILYPQVIKICEKYNLLLGHSKLFRGSIPERNTKEISNYPMEKVTENFNFNHNPNEPLFTASNPSYGGHKFKNFYICAPSKDFDKRNAYKIGHELISIEGGKPKFRIPSAEELRLRKVAKDPIVLFPVALPGLNILAFHIVTAWGPEAQEPEVFNEMQN